MKRKRIDKGARLGKEKQTELRRHASQPAFSERILHEAPPALLAWENLSGFLYGLPQHGNPQTFNNKAWSGVGTAMHFQTELAKYSKVFLMQ